MNLLVKRIASFLILKYLRNIIIIYEIKTFFKMRYIYISLIVFDIQNLENNKK